MAELLEYLARQLVDDPDAVRVEQAEDDYGGLVLHLHVADADVGKVIGRQGRVARSLRTVLRACAAGEDRRMTKAHLKVQMGGMAAATEAYRAAATPNVVVIEAEGRAEELLHGLDTLAEVCDAGTRVIVLG